MKKSFLIIGGDDRLKYLNLFFKTKNINSEHIFIEKSEKKELALNKIKSADILVLPIPLSKDKITLFAPNFNTAVTLKEITDRISNNSTVFGGGILPDLKGEIAYYNLLDDEVMTLKNAMATAEGALSVAISNHGKTIFGSNILVIGFGRIAAFLCNYLKALNGNVTVCARKAEARAKAKILGFDACDFLNYENELKNSDIIINTVPFKIINKKELLLLKKNVLILDLASSPGGIDFEAARELNINTVHALSLPGKFSPYSAAQYIEEAIINNLKGEL